MTKNPREAAAAALVKIEKDGEYSNRALLESVRGTEPRDTALATEIVMGVLRNKIYLDYSLDGTNYENVLAYEATAGRWVGVKNGIFCCHEIKQDEFNAAGSCEGKKRTGALFNCFRITELSK